VRKTVELLPHGGNGCVDSVDVVCCGTVCLASDKTRYVNLTRLVFTGVRAMACGKTAAVLSEASEALCCRRFALPVLCMGDLLRGQERRRE